SANAIQAATRSVTTMSAIVAVRSRLGGAGNATRSGSGSAATRGAGSGNVGDDGVDTSSAKPSLPLELPSRDTDNTPRPRVPERLAQKGEREHVPTERLAQKGEREHVPTERLAQKGEREHVAENPVSRLVRRSGRYATCARDRASLGCSSRCPP